MPHIEFYAKLILNKYGLDSPITISDICQKGMDIYIDQNYNIWHNRISHTSNPSLDFQLKLEDLGYTPAIVEHYLFNITAIEIEYPKN